MKDFSYLWHIFVGTFTSVWEFLAWWISAAWHSGLSPSLSSMLGSFVLIALYFGSGFFAASVAESKNRGRLPHFIAGLLLPYVYPVAILYLLPVYREGVDEDSEDGVEPFEEVPEEQPAQERHAPPPSAAPKLKAAVSHQERSDDETMRMTKVDPSATAAQSFRHAQAAPAARSGGGTFTSTATNAIPRNSRRPSLDTVTTKMTRSAISACNPAPEAAPDSGEPAAELVEPAAAAPPPMINQQYFASISVDQSGNHLGPFMLEMSDGRILEATRIVNPMPDLALLEIPGEGGQPKTIRVPYSKVASIKLKSQWIDQTH